jgi:hypothetical protein
MASLLCPVSASAQTVRGILIERGPSTPIPGAFVVLEDSSGTTVSTTLTTSSGTWLLRAPRAGEYRLRADRIGYSSAFSEWLELAAGQSVSYRLETDVSPVSLAGLEVEGVSRLCGSLREESLAIHRVWVEARKALTAIVWTGQQPYFRFDAVYFHRTLDPGGRPTSAIEYEEMRFFGRHPFHSVPPRDLVLGGFVQSVSGSLRYHAPDADVLLSNDFQRRHCFRLVRDSGLLGLVFEPLRNVRVSDISGTMWIDAESAQLRRLDFSYENLDIGVDGENLGGRVDFARLPSGAWIVRAWTIRAPILGLGPERTRGGRPLPRSLVVEAIDEGGGEVTAVYLTSRLVGRTSTDTLPVRPPPDSLIMRFPLAEPIP